MTRERDEAVRRAECRCEEAVANAARERDVAVAQAQDQARAQVREEADRALAESRRELDEEARCREGLEHELIAARSRLARLAERADRRAQRRTREQAETQLSAELAILEREAEKPSVQTGKDAAARSHAATDMRLREEEALVRQGEDEARAEAEQRAKGARAESCAGDRAAGFRRVAEAVDRRDAAESDFSPHARG